MTAPTPNNAPGPEPLSPVAQAVLDAINKELDEAPWDVSFLAGVSAAAAIRAVADQVVPAGGSRKNNEIRAELLAIADELKNQP
jgi:hypothetical protein